MKKVAVFGNAGGGKSTLARRLSEVTKLPLYPLDMIQFRKGGAKVPHAEYLDAHADLLRREAWIIDGFVNVDQRVGRREPPMWRSTLDSYRLIPLCHRHLTPRYRGLVAEAAAEKRVHHLRSPRQVRDFLGAIEREYA